MFEEALDRLSAFLSVTDSSIVSCHEMRSAPEQCETCKSRRAGAFGSALRPSVQKADGGHNAERLEMVRVKRPPWAAYCPRQAPELEP